MTKTSIGYITVQPNYFQEIVCYYILKNKPDVDVIIFELTIVRKYLKYKDIPYFIKTNTLQQLNRIIYDNSKNLLKNKTVNECMSYLKKVFDSGFVISFANSIILLNKITFYEYLELYNNIKNTYNKAQREKYNKTLEIRRNLNKNIGKIANSQNEDYINKSKKIYDLFMYGYTKIHLSKIFEVSRTTIFKAIEFQEKLISQTLRTSKPNQFNISEIAFNLYNSNESITNIKLRLGLKSNQVVYNLIRKYKNNTK